LLKPFNQYHPVRAWFSVFGFPSAFWLPLPFCNLAGKDAGQNNTKMLRGLNAEC
jgi:hypothetical protein